MMEIGDGGLPGIRVWTPRRYHDARGYFFELMRESTEALLGEGVHFVQDNVSRSRRGVIRGLHYQDPAPQGKLVCVLEGEVFDVAVDLRPQSPTYLRWAGEYLSESNGKQVYIPPGFAHGFAVTSDEALVYYKCTDYYRPDASRVLRWNDPGVGVAWPIDDPVLSEGDR